MRLLLQVQEHSNDQLLSLREMSSRLSSSQVGHRRSYERIELLNPPPKGLPFSEGLDAKPQRRTEMKKRGTANCGDCACTQWDVSFLWLSPECPEAGSPATHCTAVAAEGPAL